LEQNDPFALHSPIHFVTKQRDAALGEDKTRARHRLPEKTKQVSDHDAIRSHSCAAIPSTEEDVAVGDGPAQECAPAQAKKRRN